MFANKGKVETDHGTQLQRSKEKKNSDLFINEPQFSFDRLLHYYDDRSPNLISVHSLGLHNMVVEQSSK